VGGLGFFLLSFFLFTLLQPFSVSSENPSFFPSLLYCLHFGPAKGNKRFVRIPVGVGIKPMEGKTKTCEALPR